MATTTAVLGAGLMGRLTALALARRGHSVSLFERGDMDGSASAAFVAAGMLAVASEALDSSPLVTRLGLGAGRLWSELLAQLPEPVYHRQDGSLVVAHRQDLGEYRRFCERLQRRRAQGLDLRLSPCDRAGVEALEPDLADRFEQGLWLEDEGHLCPRQWLRVSLSALGRAGVELWPGQEAQPLEPGWLMVRGTAGTTDAGQERAFDQLVDCRGLGAAEALPGVRGIRGEVVRVYAPEVNLSRPVRLMHPRYPLYIAPRPKHHYVIGATEIESRDQGPMTLRSALELLSAAYCVHPAFAEARILSLETQCRPTLADNNPGIFLGRRYLAVNGLYRHGFLLAPALLEEVLATLPLLADLGPERARRERLARSEFPELYQPMNE